MARTKTYSDAEIIAALTECKGMAYLAAHRLGCDPGTIYDRAKANPAIDAAMKRQRGIMADIAEIQLYKALMAGEQWAVERVIKTLAKDRGYTEKTEVEHSGKISRAFEDMTDDELAAELARLEKLCAPPADPSGKASKK